MVSLVGSKVWMGAGALGLALSLAMPGRALDAVDFTVSGDDGGLAKTLRAASGLVNPNDDKSTLDLFADARAEYGRLLSALYAAGHYGPVIHVLIDGREAAGIAPLDAPQVIRRITVTVDPGPAFTFSTARIDPLARRTELPPGFAAGKPALAGTVREAVQTGIDGWRSNGNAKAAVAAQDLTADHAKAILSADVRLAPGPVLRFGDLVVNGATNISDYRVRKIAGVPSGKKFSPEEEARVAERLRRSGVFSSVAITEDDRITAPDLLGLTIDLVEAKPRRYTFGAEVASDVGLSLTGSWLHRNLLGGGERFEINGEITNLAAADNGINYAFGVTLDRPATPDADTTLNLNLDFGHVDTDDYKADYVGGGFGFTHYFTSTLTAHAALAYSFSNGTDDAGDFTYQAINLPLGVTWDRRDSKTDATRNFYIDLGAKPFVGFGSTDNGVRLTADGRAYKALGEGNKLVLAFRLQGGAILGASALGTPRTDLFYSGGGGTVRGHPYQSLGILVARGADNVKIGGTAFVAGSVEARVKVTDSIGIVGFVDAGAVGLGSVSDDSSGFQVGAGLGLRYATGFGPIRLDVAVPVSGSTGDGVQLYVGLGQAF